MKKLLAITIVILFFCMSIIPSSGIQIDNKLVVTSNRGNTLYVGGNGTGNYSKIQDAIDDASDGDTVYVYDDSSPYYELLKIEKSITLNGENRETTIIDGDYIGTVITIRADDVTISNFYICNCENSQSYYVIDAENCKNLVIQNNIIIKTKQKHTYSNVIILKGCSDNIILNNKIVGHYFDYSIDSIGIIISDDCVDNNISENEIYEFTIGIKTIGENCYNNIVNGNYIYDSWSGIEIENNGNKIMNNTISDNYHRGITINSNDNVISGNILNHNHGSHIGAVSLDISGFNNHILKNHIEDNMIGIMTGYWKDCGNNRIFYNYISRNYMVGIICESKDNIFSFNEISDNDDGIWFYTSFCNFTRNNFLRNNKHTMGNNIFRTNLFDGNYWDDWVGLNNPKKDYLPYFVFNSIFFDFFIDWHPAKEPYDITNPQSYDI